jgi:hypothetical protein
MPTPQEALNKLRSDPRDFLRTYYLKCETMGAINSSQHTFWFGGTGFTNQNNQTVHDRSPVQGTFRMHQRKNFLFTPNQPSLIGTSIQVPVWHVAVIQMGLPFNMGAVAPLQVSTSMGADIMVTTILNGCSFCCDPYQNGILMSHLMPGGGNTGDQLEQDIIATGLYESVQGDFQGANGALHRGQGTVFGAHSGYTANANDVTIVGVRTGTHWRVYAQRHTRLGLGQGTDILTVWKIFHN